MGAAWLEPLGPLALAFALVVLALISRRFGRATRAAPYYAGFLVGAALVGASGIARLLNAISPMIDPAALQHDPLWVLVYAGLPALGLTIALGAAWRYWSWLLAERD